MRIAIVVLALCVSGVAAAQAPGQVPRTTIDAKDRNAAYAWSVLGIVAAPFAFAAGLKGGAPGVLGGTVAFIALPSAGHWYSGHILTGGMGLRAIGTVSAGLAIARLVACEGECGAHEGTAIAVYGGFGLIAAGAIWDLATAGSEVDRWNRAHGMTIEATALRFDRGGYGVGFAGRF